MQEVLCPRCNRLPAECTCRFKVVDSVTVRSLVTDDARARVGHVEGFRFYLEPDCDIVYFNPQTGDCYLRDDLRVKVWQKETESDCPVCYCFNHTVKDIEAQVAQTGQSTFIRDISKKCSQGFDRCALNNPQGSCCLGNVKKTIEDAQMKYKSAPNHRRGLLSSLAAGPAVVAGFLPTVTCPACWPAYAGLMSALGLGFLMEDQYLLATMSVLLALAIVCLAANTRKRRKTRGKLTYGPLVLGLAGSLILLDGKFVLTRDSVMYGGIGLLVAASLWNAWPVSKQKNTACGSCCES